MRISDDALEEFIALYKEEFGEDIDLAHARELAQRVVTLYRLLRRKLPEKSKTRIIRDDDRQLSIGFHV